MVLSTKLTLIFGELSVYFSSCGFETLHKIDLDFWGIVSLTFSGCGFETLHKFDFWDLSPCPFSSCGFVGLQVMVGLVLMTALH